MPLAWADDQPLAAIGPTVGNCPNKTGISINPGGYVRCNRPTRQFPFCKPVRVTILLASHLSVEAPMRKAISIALAIGLAFAASVIATLAKAELAPPVTAPSAVILNPR